MKKSKRRYDESFLLKVFILGNILAFLWGCAGSKSEQKSTPAPADEKKVEQPRKEETSPPQPAQEPPSKPIPAPSQPSPPEPQKVVPSPPPPSQPPALLRVTTILWTSVNLREGPGLNYKVVGTAKKGTTLTVLEEKGTWFKVLLEDGREVWVSKAATSEAPKSAPAGPSKPKPM
jgi:type IV secretory pathway VirB10-like protein